MVYKDAPNPTLIDVMVTHRVSLYAEKLLRNATTDGAGAQAGEADKRDRYPRARDLVPFVIEAGGRIGKAPREFVRRVAPGSPSARAEAIGELWQDISTQLQKSNAWMIMRSTGH